MDLLDACLEKNVRLVDYEKMCDESGNHNGNFARKKWDLFVLKNDIETYQLYI